MVTSDVSDPGGNGDAFGDVVESAPLHQKFEQLLKGKIF